MALKGTIRDFGVADIFQLISQQAKTGVLVLSNDVDTVRVYFREGSVVRAENTTRPAQMLLGTFMVRAGVLTQDKLDHALKEQAKTLKRIGAVLAELSFVSAAIVTEFATLQMTETIYQLFEWTVGTYEFETIDVEPSPEGVQPIRAESIVMNGIRMTDEWPGIRERIPSYGWSCERMRELPAAPERKKSNDDFDFSSFGEGEGGGSSGIDEIGSYERQIFTLIHGGRSVQQIIDLSRVGEFEACRALSTLVGAGYIRIVRPGDKETSDLSDMGGTGERVMRLAKAMVRIGISAGLVVLAVWLFGRAPGRPGDASGMTLELKSRPVERHVAEAQVRVIRRALDVYRFNHGGYPQSLSQLVEAGILSERDLRFPFRQPYYYELAGNEVKVLPPLR